MKTVFLCSATMACVLSVQLTFGQGYGTPVVYEPFEDNNTTLTGNVPGEGLSSWSGSTAFIVVSSNLAWGILVTNANSVVINAAGNISGNLDTTLVNAGLMSHGTSLWFSLIIDTPTSGGTNPDTGFAIGSGTVGSGNNIPMSGQGFGWSIKNNVLQASYWNGGSVNRSGGSSVGNNLTVFIVGEINWGADTNSPDVIKLYRPDTELILGSVISSNSAVLNQSSFDRLSFGLKNNTSFEFDEIRFGATYEDVAILPPPRGTVIGLY